MCDSTNSDLPEMLQTRLCSLRELTEFTESCQAQLKELFDALGWDQELDPTSTQMEPMEVCPYDPNHHVPSRRLERHKAACQLNQMGYSKEEQDMMYDPSVCYENANIPSMVMDKHLQQQIILQARASAPPARSAGQYGQSEYSAGPSDVPQNHMRATCDLTVADRLALYNHVMSEVSQQKATAESGNNEDLYVDWVAKLKKGDGQSGPKSHLEVLAEMRDYRRRRQSYRAKNVHITKKSYTEVIREVINVHSGQLATQWEEEQREEEAPRATKHSSHRRGSEDRRSASVESRQSHVSSRDGHSAKDGHSSRHKHKHKHKRSHKRKRSRERSGEPSGEGEGSIKRERDSHSPEERRRGRKKKTK